MDIGAVCRRAGLLVQRIPKIHSNSDMSRRDFCKVVGAGGAALAVSPSLVLGDKPEEVFKQRLDLKLRELVELVKDKKELEKGINELISIGLEDDDMFGNWLYEVVSNRADEINLEKRDEVLEKTIRYLVTNRLSYYTDLPHEERPRVFNKFVPAYIKLVGNNNTSPDILASSLIAFKEMRNLSANSLKDNQPTEHAKNMDFLIPLFDVTVAGIGNLLDSKDKRFLIRQLFTSLEMFSSDDKTTQDKVVKAVTEYFFENNPDYVEVVTDFMDSVRSNSDTKIPQTKLSTYLLFKLINDNRDYFTDNTLEMIRRAENTDNRNEREVLMSSLVNILESFEVLPRIKSTSSMQYDDNRDLRTAIHSWSAFEIKKPIVDFFLSRLKKESVAVKVTETPKGYEREINNRDWISLNKNLALVASSNSSAFNGFPGAISARLNTDSSPYDREMDYLSIGAFLLTDSKQQAVPLQMLRDRFIKEDSLQGLRGIGSALAQLAIHEKQNEQAQCGQHAQDWEMKSPMRYELRTFYNFFIELDKIISGKYEHKKLKPISISSGLFPNFILAPVNVSRDDALLELRSGGLTTAQTFIVDLVRLVGWDFDYYKKLLPECTFETYKIDDNGKQIKNTDDFIKAMKLRHRALLTLAYCISSIPDYQFGRNGYFSNRGYGLTEQQIRIVIGFKEIFTRVIEENLGAYSLPEKWGEEASALLEIYRNYDGGGSTYRHERETYLSEHYFGNDGLFERYEQGLAALKKEESKNTDPQKKIKETREEFAKRFLDSAPSECFLTYRDCLGSLGFRSSEINPVVSDLLALASN